MEDPIRIAEAKKMRNGINTKAIVKSKGDKRTVNLKSGGTTDVCDAIIKDGDTQEDEMKMTLWGEDIAKVNVGDEVEISNGYTTEFRGEVSLGKGKYGKMRVNGADA